MVFGKRNTRKYWTTFPFLVERLCRVCRGCYGSIDHRKRHNCAGNRYRYRNQHSEWALSLMPISASVSTISNFMWSGYPEPFRRRPIAPLFHFQGVIVLRWFSKCRPGGSGEAVSRLRFDRLAAGCAVRAGELGGCCA